MSEKIKIKFSPTREAVTTEKFYSRDEKIIEELKEEIRKFTNELEKEIELEFVRSYVEWPRPYGHDPYVVIIFNFSMRPPAEQYNSFLENLEDFSEGLYDEFTVKNLNTAALS